MADLSSEIELLAAQQAELQKRLAETVRLLEKLAATLPQSLNTPTAGSSPGTDSFSEAGLADFRLVLREHERAAQATQRRLREMEERCEAFVQLTATNTARIDEILQSRIWRLFTRFGALLLKLAGR